MLRPRLAAPFPLLAAVMVSGCATGNDVREQIAALEARQDERIEAIDKTAQDALLRAAFAGKLAQGKFVYAVVVRDDSVKFPHNRAGLSPQARRTLSALARRLLAGKRSVYLEIQGYTDDVGDPDYNLQLGQARADAVYRFLHRQGIAGDRMSAISYGEDNPTAPNETPEGRATNRRIAVVVLN